MPMIEIPVMKSRPIFLNMMHLVSAGRRAPGVPFVKHGVRYMALESEAFADVILRSASAQSPNCRLVPINARRCESHMTICRKVLGAVHDRAHNGANLNVSSSVTVV